MTRSSRPKLAKLIPFNEPLLRFKHDQLLDDPKDGLSLFGPPEAPNGLRFGVVGSRAGIAQLKSWTQKIARVVPRDQKVGSSVTFPGFEAAFREEWDPEPRVTCQIDEDALAKALTNPDDYQRVFDIVEIYAQPIRRWIAEEDPKVAFWFVVIPEEVWKTCRPQSKIMRKDAVKTDVYMTHAKALATHRQNDLFSEINEAAAKHKYHNHFHNQLKAKLLECEAVTQVVRQSTIAPYAPEHLNSRGEPKRRLQDDATVSWNLATAIYYKSGAKPWTLAGIRDGVCYIGLVFKRSTNPDTKGEICCGAQMFLHTGEGIVFKGAVGDWESEKAGEFHLPKEQAKEIVSRCLEAYKVWHGTLPSELFIHGRTHFSKAEIDGFREAAPEGVSVNGIQIRRPNDLKLFREGRQAVLRGVALEVSKRAGFLWTSGYVPKLGTYPGREVPTPLKVKIVFGDAKLTTVLADILALTKVNFNACLFADGMPVTLRFADDIGEILTAIPEVSSKPLPFRHYI